MKGLIHSMMESVNEFIIEFQSKTLLCNHCWSNIHTVNTNEYMVNRKG